MNSGSQVIKNNNLHIYKTKSSQLKKETTLKPRQVALDSKQDDVCMYDQMKSKTLIDPYKINN